jgi:hypothetical protein
MNDAIAIALELGARNRRFFFEAAATRLGRMRGIRGEMCLEREGRRRNAGKLECLVAHRLLRIIVASLFASLFLLGSWLGRVLGGDGFVSVQREADQSQRLGISARCPDPISLAGWWLLQLSVTGFSPSRASWRWPRLKAESTKPAQMASISGRYCGSRVAVSDGVQPHPGYRQHLASATKFNARLNVDISRLSFVAP